MTIITKTNKIAISLLYLFAFASILYPFEAIQSIIMAITCLFLLFQYKNSKNSLFTVYKLPFYISFFILLGFNLFYFHSKSIQTIANSFLIFIIPLFSMFLYESSFFLRNKQNIILTYSLCIGCISLYIIYFYINDIPNHHFNWYFARFNLENTIHIHGTYISLWIGVAFLFIFDYFLNTQFNSVSKYGLLFLIFIYLASLVIINTRMILYSIPIIGTVNYFLKTKNKKQKKIIIIVTLLPIILILLSQRYKDDALFFYKNSIENSSRYTICYCSIQTIAESDFIGLDNGLIQRKLNECYNQYGFEDLSKENLNSHNQYLDYFLKGGFLLFITFILTLFLKLQNAYKTKNYLFFSITVLFTLSFFTENILVRQYGIYIYLFCDILFLGSILPNKSHCADEIKKC